MSCLSYTKQITSSSVFRSDFETFQSDWMVATTFFHISYGPVCWRSVCARTATLGLEEFSFGAHLLANLTESIGISYTVCWFKRFHHEIPSKSAKREEEEERESRDLPLISNWNTRESLLRTVIASASDSYSSSNEMWLVILHQSTFYLAFVFAHQNDKIHKKCLNFRIQTSLLLPFVLDLLFIKQCLTEKSTS